MSWFSSDDLPEIPADILEKLDSRFDRGDCFDVPEADVGDDLGDQRGGLDERHIRRVSGILRRHSP